MGETRKDRARSLILWLPRFSEMLVMKDPGQIAQHLAEIGYNVKIVSYRSDRQIECPSRLDRARIEYLPYAHRFYGLYRLLDFPFYRYLLRKRGTIHCLILYAPSPASAVASLVYRLCNRGGVCMVKMDSDGRLYGSSGIVIKELRSQEGSTVYEGTRYKIHPARRALSRVIGEVTFRLLSYTVDLVTIESPEARQRLLRVHPWLRRKLIVLPNGVNTRRLAELSESIRGERERKILFVGRVEHAKGVDLLIEAFSRVKDKHPDWSLELVGTVSPSFKDQLADLVSQGLEGRVTLPGPKHDRELAEEYLSSEIFCLASRRESFGIALVEAMYFGAAVVSADVGAARYVLDYGNAGMIFDSENVEQLTACLDTLMGDRQLRARLAGAAKSRCDQQFDWVKIIEELHRCISTIIGRKSPPRGRILTT